MISDHRFIAFCSRAALLLSTLICGHVLAQSATIEGTITEASGGTPIAGATVAVSDPEGYQRVEATGTTDGSGNYSISVSVPAGASAPFLVEAASPDHAPGRHGFSGTIKCYFGCPETGGAINVSDGSTVTDIDIGLDPGGRISGAVTAADTGGGLADARVSILKSGDIAQYSDQFDGVATSAGSYTTPLAVSPADYHVWVKPAYAPGSFPEYADNYVPEAWNNKTCEFLRCPVARTDTVAVNSGATTAGIDFSLDPGATLSGSLGPDSIEKLVALYDGAGTRLRAIFMSSADLPRTAWSFNGLAGGSYYVQLGPLSFSTYLRELHNGLACPYSGCERASGTPLNVPAGANLNLPLTTLAQGGQLEGVVIDAATNGTPSGSPPNAELGNYDIIDAGGTVVGAGRMTTDASGAISLDPSFAVPPGDYYVRTYNEFVGDGIGDANSRNNLQDAALDGYMDAVFPDEACAGIECDLSAATPVTVTAGNTSSIILEVAQGSVIEGTVVDAGTGQPFPETLVRVVDVAGETLAIQPTDSNGDFRFGALPSGDYYVRTSMSGFAGLGDRGVQHPYFDRVHGAPGTCSEALCDPASGTAISLDGSSNQSLGDLEVSAGPIISGQIIEVPTGYPIGDGQVDVYTDTGEFVGGYKVAFLDATYRTTALPPGTYTLVPNVSPAYSATTTSGGTTPTAVRGQADSPEGISVTIGTESVEADVAVVDQAFDELFNDRFKNTLQGN